MASLSNKKPNKSYDIFFDGALLSDTRGLLVVEIMKFLLYQRQQIPVPFDELKNLPKKESSTSAKSSSIIELQNMAKSFLSNKPSFKGHQSQKTDGILSHLSQLFDQTQKTFEKCPEIEQVAIVFGSTVMSPKESIVINFPPSCADADCVPFQTGKRLLFKQMMEQDVLGSLPVTLGPTNLMLTLSAPRACPVQWFLPKIALKAPKRGAVVTLNLCCSYMVPIPEEVTVCKDDLSIISGIVPLDCSLCGHESSDRKSELMGDKRRSGCTVQTGQITIDSEGFKEPPSRVPEVGTQKEACLIQSSEIVQQDHFDSGAFDNVDHILPIMSLCSLEGSARKAEFSLGEVSAVSTPLPSVTSDITSGLCQHRAWSFPWLRVDNTQGQDEVLASSGDHVQMNVDQENLGSQSSCGEFVWYQSPLTIKGLKLGNIPV